MDVVLEVEKADCKYKKNSGNLLSKVGLEIKDLTYSVRIEITILHELLKRILEIILK